MSVNDMDIVRRYPQDPYSGLLNGAFQASMGAILSGVMVYRSSHGQFSFHEYMKKCLQGLVAGSLNGIVSYTNPGSYLVGERYQMAVPLINILITRSLITTFQMVTQKDWTQKIETKKLVKAAVKEVTKSLVSVATEQLGSKLYETIQVNSLVRIRYDESVLLAALQGAVEGTSAGMLNSTTDKILENILESKKWSKGLSKSIVLGSLSGCMSGGFSKIQQYREIKKFLDKYYFFGDQNRVDRDLDQGELGYYKLKLKFMFNEGKFLTKKFARTFDKLQRVKAEYANRVSGSYSIQVHGDFIVKKSLARIMPQGKISASALLVNQVAELFHSSNIEIVVDWTELSKHVVLVHAFSTDSVAFHYPESFSYVENNDEVGLMAFVLSKVLTKEGVLGEKIAESDRPQLHWSWNQLVQPHGQNNWEHMQFAILEPLAMLEQTSPPFGLAPYDTMTHGSYKLSKEAILLVPNAVAAQAHAYFSQNFEGRVVPYDDSLGTPIRQVIFEALNEHYPQVWHIADENDELTAPKVVPTRVGYYRKTYLKNADGQSYHVMDGSGMDGSSLSPALGEAKQSGRFIGLHAYFPTNLLEQSSYFKSLLAFKKDPQVTLKKDFIGQEGLGILEALEFYLDLNQLDKRTKMGNFGENIFHIALQADITSLMLAKFQGEPLLTPNELMQIIYSIREPVVELLTQIKNGDTKKTDVYANLLLTCIACMKKAREIVNNLPLIERDGLPYYLDDILWGASLQEEWRRAYEQENCDVDFSTRLSLTPHEEEFFLQLHNIIQERRISTLEGSLFTIRKMVHVLDEENKEQKTKLCYLAYGLEMFLKKTYYSRLKQEKEKVGAARAMIALRFADRVENADFLDGLNDNILAFAFGASAVPDINSFHDVFQRNAQGNEKLTKVYSNIDKSKYI